MTHNEIIDAVVLTDDFKKAFKEIGLGSDVAIDAIEKLLEESDWHQENLIKEALMCLDQVADAFDDLDSALAENNREYADEAMTKVLAHILQHLKAIAVVFLVAGAMSATLTFRCSKRRGRKGDFISGRTR